VLEGNAPMVLAATNDVALAAHFDILFSACCLKHDMLHRFHTRQPTRRSRSRSQRNQQPDGLLRRAHP